MQDFQNWVSKQRVFLSISGGLATFPWDASDIDGLLEKADQRLLQSKRHGKNSITIGKDE